MKDAPSRLSKRAPEPDIEPDLMAIQALTFLTGNPEHGERFFSASGFSPLDLPQAASYPDFLVGILDFVMSDEPTLLAFAADAAVPPEAVVSAHDRLTRR